MNSFEAVIRVVKLHGTGDRKPRASNITKRQQLSRQLPLNIKQRSDVPDSANSYYAISSGKTVPKASDFVIKHKPCARRTTTAGVG